METSLCSRVSFFDARPTDVKDGKKIYRKDGDKYVVAKRNPVYSYDRETLFPRIYSEKGGILNITVIT